MKTRATAALVGLVLSTAPHAEDSFTTRTAALVSASRKCKTTFFSPKKKCTYTFNGIELVLTLDARAPESNAFVVKAAPSDGDTLLRFGGLHACATISHRGNGSMGNAQVFISPRDGEVYTRSDVPACAK